MISIEYKLDKLSNANIGELVIALNYKIVPVGDLCRVVGRTRHNIMLKPITWDTKNNRSNDHDTYCLNFGNQPTASILDFLREIK